MYDVTKEDGFHYSQSVALSSLGGSDTFGAILSNPCSDH